MKFIQYILTQNLQLKAEISKDKKLYYTNKIKKALTNFSLINLIDFSDTSLFHSNIIVIKFENLTAKHSQSVRISEYTKILKFIFTKDYFSTNFQKLLKRMCVIDSLVFDGGKYTDKLNQFGNVDFTRMYKTDKWPINIGNLSCLDTFLFRLKSIHRVSGGQRKDTWSAWDFVNSDKICKSWASVMYYATMFGYHPPKGVKC